MAHDEVRILDGTSFLVCDRSGDIESEPEQVVGLFAHDMRILSTWVMTVDGERLSPLSLDDLSYYENRFFLLAGRRRPFGESSLSVIRLHTLETGLLEDLTIINHGENDVDLTVRVQVGADFVDIFELREGRAKKGRHYRRVEEARLVLGYERERFRRELIVSATVPARFDEQGMTFEVHIEPRARWTARLSARPDLAMPRGLERLRVPGRAARISRDKRQDLDRWLAQAPRLEASWDPLCDTYRQSLVDLAALRFAPFLANDRTVLAAGLPWVMCLVGRDSIFASFQALPFTPELAATTLRVLALRQGSRIDNFREEQPGRILHEMRYGELTAFEEKPHSPYFGSADATPLFLVLLDEYEQWTGDAELVRQLEEEARAALTWIDEYADLMGNGYVAYERRSARGGLENQCWKNSWDGISFRDGRLPDFPRATCELQGYAYDAKVRAARLAREIWDDPALAERLESQAGELKRRFNRDFWMADRESFALALDGRGEQVDALSSNIGHLLWSGIVDEDRAEAVVGRLFSPEMFTGWGVRTLAESEQRYNPIGFHVGAVWPFDNSVIAWGLRRYGFKEEAARLSQAVLDAAFYFKGRMPQAFAGYARAETKYPVLQPDSCSPYASSAGATLLFLRTLLGLQVISGKLVAEPSLPTSLDFVKLLEIPGRWGRHDAFGRGGKMGRPRRRPAGT